LANPICKHIAKAHEPKLCQRASKANPSSPQGFLSNAQKNKINLCFVGSLVGFGKMITLDLNN
jgi:hypothetical protein